MTHDHPPLKLVDLADLAARPPQGKYAQAASMLETAARMLREDGQDRADSAAWRVADAGGILRNAMQADGWTEAAGLDQPTGRGCLLPTVTRP